MITSREVLNEVGITKRQLEHWIIQGYLKPNESNPGTGNKLSWRRSEIQIAKMMQRLIHVGFIVSAAADYARMMIENGESFVDLGERCLLMVELET